MVILITEDEVHIGDMLERYILKAIADRQPKIFRCSDVASAVAFISSHPIDALFLDLNLRGQDGFKIMENFMTNDFHTIVVSAYRDRAIEAFEYGVIDFISKPFTPDRVSKALNRIFVPGRPPEHAVKYLFARKDSEIKLVPVRLIVYIQSIGHYTKLYYEDGRFEICSKSIAKIAPLLEEDFRKVHKSFIVRISSVARISVKSGGKYQAILKNNAVIPISRNFYAALTKGK